MEHLQDLTVSFFFYQRDLDKDFVFEIFLNPLSWAIRPNFFIENNFENGTNVIYLIDIWQMSWQSHDLNHDQTKYPTENFISQNFFDLWPHGPHRGQKHPSDAQNGMKKSIYRKKFLLKVAQQPQNPVMGPIRFELQPQGRKLWFLRPPWSQLW